MLRVGLACLVSLALLATTTAEAQSFVDPPAPPPHVQVAPPPPVTRGPFVATPTQVLRAAPRRETTLGAACVLLLLAAIADIPAVVALASAAHTSDGGAEALALFLGYTNAGIAGTAAILVALADMVRSHPPGAVLHPDPALVIGGASLLTIAALAGIGGVILEVAPCDRRVSPNCALDLTWSGLGMLGLGTAALVVGAAMIANGNRHPPLAPTVSLTGGPGQVGIGLRATW